MTIKKTIIIDVDADDAVKEMDKLDDSVKDTTKSTKRLSTGIKAVGTALKAAGIGLVIALFAKLGEIVSKNQKVMNFFSNTMTSLEIAFKDLFNFVTNNFIPAVERVKTFFENLTFESVGKAIKENLIERFNSLLEVFGFVAKAFRRLRDGDLDGAFDAIKEAGKEMIDVYTGVDDTVGKVKNTVTKAAKAIGNYATETFKAAQAMTDLNNQALIAESINKGLIEQYDRQAEQLRQIRDDDLRSIEDRILANERLGRVLDEQESLMLANADLAIKAAENQYNLNKNIENQIALQDALNERAGIQAQIEGFRSEQLVNTNALLREKNELEKESAEKIEGLETDALEKRNKRNKEKAEQDQKDADNEIILAQNVEDAKYQIANATSNLIRMIAGEDSKVAKGVAVAQSTINAYQGITSTLAAPTTIPEPFGTALKIANAAMIGGMAFRNVKNIIATDPSKGGGGGSSSARRGGGGSAPSFNLVAGTGTNQIAEGLNKEAPIAKAYVVSSDVSSSQELDRKIVEGASL